MKLRTLARLDMLAAEREAQALEAMRRQNAAMRQAEVQLEMLAAYKNRLAESWQSGGVVDAAQAQRAGRFITTAEAAEAQLVQSGRLAAGQLAEAIGSLSEVKAHRRILAKNLRKLVQAQERAAERRQERDLPTRQRR